MFNYPKKLSSPLSLSQDKKITLNKRKKCREFCGKNNKVVLLHAPNAWRGGGGSRGITPLTLNLDNTMT
jgi:hypothetical protein